MAIKVTVQTTLSKQLQKVLKDSKEPIDKKTADKVGETVTDMMREVIAKGVSPIRGLGKFPRYINPNRYPGNRKSKTPVNLKLTGDFLDALSFTPVTDKYGYATQIFYSGKSEEMKERGHREGANGQPERPTIPADKGQQFIRQIEDAYVEILSDRIFQVIKGSG